MNNLKNVPGFVYLTDRTDYMAIIDIMQYAELPEPVAYFSTEGDNHWLPRVEAYYQSCKPAVHQVLCLALNRKPTRSEISDANSFMTVYLSINHELSCMLRMPMTEEQGGTRDLVLLCAHCDANPAVQHDDYCQPCIDIHNEEMREELAMQECMDECTDGFDQPGMESHAANQLAALFGNMPLAVTKTGLRVANFSSFHPFEMNDGTVVPACTLAWSDAQKMDIGEMLYDQSKKFETVELFITLTPTTNEAIEAVMWAQEQKLVDVVLVPLMLMNALRESGWDSKRIFKSPFRTIRKLERNKLPIFCDKFCL